MDRRRTLLFTWSSSYDHRPSHFNHAGMERVKVSPTRQTALAPSAKRRKLFGESHDGGGEWGTRDDSLWTADPIARLNIACYNKICVGGNRNIMLACC